MLNCAFVMKGKKLMFIRFGHSQRLKFCTITVEVEIFTLSDKKTRSCVLNFMEWAQDA